jgi:hypothetical protein
MAKVRIGGFSDAPLLKWGEQEPGLMLEVKVHGVRKGDYGHLADAELLADALLAGIGRLAPGAMVTLTLPTALEARVKKIRIGGATTILYRGMKKGKRGEFYAFDVDADDQDLLPEGEVAF